MIVALHIKAVGSGQFKMLAEKPHRARAFAAPSTRMTAATASQAAELGGTSSGAPGFAPILSLQCHFPDDDR